MLKIIERDKSFVSGYKEYCQEFYDNNIFTFRPTNPARIDDTWFERTFDWYASKKNSYHYWAVDGDRFIGEFQLRTELTDEIIAGMGSIGYSVRVTEQGKGYGKELLRQGLDIARSYALEKVLMTISDTNFVSAHICESFGGVLMDKTTVTTEGEGEHLIRRYWIYL